MTREEFDAALARLPSHLRAEVLATVAKDEERDRTKREATDRLLTMTLAKSHGILRDLTALRRG